MKHTFIRSLGSFPQTPAPVQNLIATAVSSTEIDLTWTGIAGAQNYTVRRNGDPIFTGLTTSYQSTGLAPSTQYSYTVAAINSFGEGQKSNVAVATTQAALSPPAQVTGLVANPISTSEIDLAWSTAARAVNYLIQRNASTIASTAGLSYPDTGLTQATTYQYNIIATNGAGNGPASASVFATTAAQEGGGSTLQSNYGFYGCFDYSGGVNADRFANGDKGIINNTQTTTVQGNPPDNLMGFGWIISWRSLDSGTSGPSYNWTVNDSYVNACRAKGKQYWIWVNPTAFASSGSSITTGSRCVPDWLVNQLGLAACMGNYALGGARQVGAGVYVKWYTTGVFNAFVALIQAIVNRYRSDPLFEGVAFCIGTANAVANVVDTLGTKAPQINYDTGYSDTGMITGYKNLMSACRAMTNVQNFWFTTDYLFNMAGASSYTGQDVQWTSIFDTAVANKCALGGVDSWTRNWVYPQTPFTSTGQNAYATPTNTNYRRSIYSDQIYRGWRGPTPGVGNGYRGDILFIGCQELTEMGGYLGAFGAADVWSTKGPALDNCNYMFYDVNYGQSGNYNINNAPNTLWTSTTAYEATYGQSVYNFIKSAGNTNQVNPYA